MQNFVLPGNGMPRMHPHLSAGVYSQDPGLTDNDTGDTRISCTGNSSIPVSSNPRPEIIPTRKS